MLATLSQDAGSDLQSITRAAASPAPAGSQVVGYFESPRRLGIPRGDTRRPALVLKGGSSVAAAPRNRRKGESLAGCFPARRGFRPRRSLREQAAENFCYGRLPWAANLTRAGPAAGARARAQATV